MAIEPKRHEVGRVPPGRLFRCGGLSNAKQADPCKSIHHASWLGLSDEETPGPAVYAKRAGRVGLWLANGRAIDAETLSYQ